MMIRAGKIALRSSNINRLVVFDRLDLSSVAEFEGPVEDFSFLAGSLLIKIRQICAFW